MTTNADKPLAIDLFCGLFQAEFILRADSSVKKFVASRTEDPNHVRLRVRCHPPRSIAFELWFVRYFKNAILSAGLAGTRHARPPAREPIKCNVFIRPLLLVCRASLFVFARRPYPAMLASRLSGAVHRTISLVCVWRHDFKMPSTPSAIAPVLCRAFMLIPTNSSSLLGALITAPFRIGFGCLKWLRAKLTFKVVHGNIIA